MITSFNSVGRVKEIHPRHSNQFGDSIAITVISNHADVFHFIGTGKVLSVIEDKLRVGDLIYIDGRVRIDRNLSTSVPKNVCINFINYLTILSEGDSK